MFSSRLLLESSASPDLWIVREPLCWQSEKYGKLVCPVGFVTDLASIPRVLRNLSAFDPNGLSRRPAVMHDWLYWWQGLGKRLADEFLHDAMIAEGAKVADAWAFFTAVSDFGASSWADGTARGLASHFETPAAYHDWLSAFTHL